MEKERSTLSDTNMAQDMYVEIVDMAFYMVNRSSKMALVRTAVYSRIYFITEECVRHTILLQAAGFLPFVRGVPLY